MSQLDLSARAYAQRAKRQVIAQHCRLGRERRDIVSAPGGGITVSSKDHGGVIKTKIFRQGSSVIDLLLTKKEALVECN